MCVRRKKENVNRMRILPEGFGWKVLAAMAAAVAGNILVQYVIPWPDFMKASSGGLSCGSLSAFDASYSAYGGRRDISQRDLCSL